ncbi:hypothetical protein OG599_02520 [Streptomyces sp. NBC_01335]|nr:hypothetical protein OG599_02520 [Streptomyces sp. NBC_01335]
MARIRTTGGAAVAVPALPAAAVFDGVPAAARAHAEDEGNIWDLFPRDEG